MTRRIVSTVVLILLFMNAMNIGVIKFAAQGAGVGQSPTDWWTMFRHYANHTGYSASVVSKDVQELMNTSNAGESIMSSPAVVNDMIYVGTLKGDVIAWNTTQLSTPRPSLRYGAFYGSPAVVDEVIYIGSNDTKVYALYAANMSEKWNTPGQTGGAIKSSPVVHGGVVYIGSSDGYLYAFNATNGNELWKFWTASSVESSPAFFNDTIYFGTNDGRLYALEKTGRYKWHFQANGSIISSPAVADGKVFVGSNDTYVYALDATTGIPVWASPFKTNGSVTSSPAVAFGRVFIGSDDGNVYAIEALTGYHNWTYPTLAGEPVSSSPAVSADGLVFVGCNDSRLYVLEAENGTHVYDFNTGKCVFSSPAIARGLVFMGSNDGYIHVFGRNRPPTAVINVSPTVNLIVTQRIRFDGSQSSDPDTNVTGDKIGRYLWNFGDGSFESQKGPFKRAYFRPGTYNVTLTVWDSYDKSDTASCLLNISEAWPMFRRDQNHTGNGLSYAPVNNQTTWIRTLETAVPSGYPYSSPIVVGDTVYICSTNNIAYAFDVNGTQKWNKPLEPSGGYYTYTSPAYSEGMVYFACGNGYLHALEADDGSAAWPTSPKLVSVDARLSSPTVDGDIVYVAAGRYVYAFDKNVGTSMTPSSALDEDIIWGAPAVAYDRLFIGTAAGSVYALNATKLNQLKWRFQCGVGEVTSSPAIADGRVFIGSRNNRLYALNATTDSVIGEEEWTYTTGDDIDSSPAVADGVVYFGSKDGTFYALDTETKEELWKKPIGPINWSSPAVAEGKVFVGSRNTIYALSIAEKGKVSWSYETYGAVQSSPAILNDALFVGSQDGCLYAFHSETHDIAVTGVLPEANEVPQGDTIDINVTVRNAGTFNETDVNITVYYDSNIIGTMLINMIRGNTATPSFLWDTNATGTPVPEDVYTINATATVAQDDHPDNNFKNCTITVSLYRHDIAVLNVTTSKTDCEPEPLVGQTKSVRIYVEVENQGNTTETFNVTIYATNSSGSFYVTQLQLTLNPSNKTILSYNWSTVGFACCHYILNATAKQVPLETDISDNTFAGEPLLVSLVGDVNADSYVGIDDIFAIALHFGTERGGPPNSKGYYYNPNCDLNDDDYIGIDDIFEAAGHFGQEREYPT